MRHLFDYKDLVVFPAEQRIVTIGNFDGVHNGHQAVLAKAAQEADRLDLELAVLTFEPHPAELLKPEGPRLRLVEPERKAELLAEHGASLVLAQRFNKEFAHLTADRFVTDVLVRALGAKQIIVGRNFRFGRKRQGDVEALIRFGKELGFSVQGEQLVQSDEANVSSSRIRQLLIEGDVAGARQLLTRCHEVPGKVVLGHGLGKDLGFPTVNLGDVKVLVPGPGIYAAYCDVDDQVLMAAVYIGDRPTLGHGYTIEGYLLDFSGDLYGKQVILRFIERVRGDKKFASPSLLAEQIARDVAEARAFIMADRD